MTMKIKSLIGIVALVALASCQDAQRKTIDNLVYFNEASRAKSVDVALQSGGATHSSLIVRMAKSIGEDIVVDIVVDEEVLEAYNKKNESKFKLPKKEDFTFTAQATIKAGEVAALPIAVEIKKFKPEPGVQYAIPLRIASIAGSVEQSESSSSIVLTLKAPLRQHTPKFTGKNGMKVKPFENWNMSLKNYTLEWWSRVTSSRGDGGYTKNNQALFNSGSASTEFYVRFGDLIHHSQKQKKYVYNFLQMKAFGSQFDTGHPDQGKGLNPGEWIHFAITYDSQQGATLLYKNGEVVATLKTPAGQEMLIDKFAMISSGTQYFPDYCELAQVRFWKVTRSGNQIRKFMKSEVEYTHPELIFYLPMNEGKGSLMKDVTGNGHDVVAGSLSSSHSPDITWQEYTF
ncbi:Laminin_G_3 domain containing protein [Mucinivorans hirudinis]|uniref:Laminin_G_3 domain containing protein n=1 Tax=Mucinivorans hirudinis TaxID=1433126 RepID=A0A060R9T4_9BACT|nr:Laminin_G_3 domain containing protein [Mucinivorans hirudinis]